MSISLCRGKPSFLIASNVLGDVCQVAPAGGAQLERGAPNCSFPIITERLSILLNSVRVAWNYRSEQARSMMRRGQPISRGTVEQMVRGGERRWLFPSNKAIAASEGIAKRLKLAASTVERAFTCGLGAGPALPGAELSGGRCSR